MDVCSFVLVDDVDNIHNVMLMYHPKLARQGKGWFNVNRLAAAFGWQIIDGVCVVFYAPAEVHHQVHTIFQFLDWQGGKIRVFWLEVLWRFTSLLSTEDLTSKPTFENTLIAASFKQFYHFFKENRLTHSIVDKNGFCVTTL